MNYIEAALLGVVQGLTEFLPVSSSGHLVVFQGLLGFQQDTPEMFTWAPRVPSTNSRLR